MPSISTQARVAHGKDIPFGKKTRVHQYLESNLEHPRKQRLTAKRIWELLVRDGHKIGYTSVKDDVARWKRTNRPREVYILQEPRVGQRAEFDWGEAILCIGGIWSKFYLAVFVLPFSLYLQWLSTCLTEINAHAKGTSTLFRTRIVPGS